MKIKKWISVILSFGLTSIAIAGEPTFKIFESKKKGEENFLVFETKFYKYNDNTIKIAKDSKKPLLVFVDCEPRKVEGFTVAYATAKELQTNQNVAANKNLYNDYDYFDFKSGTNKILVSFYQKDKFVCVPLDGKASDDTIRSTHKANKACESNCGCSKAGCECKSGECKNVSMMQSPLRFLQSST